MPPVYLSAGPVAGVRRMPAWPMTLLAANPNTEWWGPSDLSDGLVSSWPGKIHGVTNAQTQATPGLQPTKSSTPIDGKPGVVFTKASTHRLVGSAALAAMLANQTPFTLMYTSKLSHTVDGFYVGISIARTSGAADQFFASQSVNSGIYAADVTYRTAQIGGGVRTGGIDQRGVTSITYDGTTLTMRRDGVQAGSAAQGTIGTPNAICFGAQLQAGSFLNPFGGTLGHIVLVPGVALPDSDLTAGEAWMRRQYATTRTKVVLGYGDSYEEGYGPIIYASYPAGYPDNRLWMVRNARKVQGLYAPSGEGFGSNGDSPGDFLSHYVQANTGLDVIHVNAGWGALQVSQMVPGTAANDRLLNILSDAMAIPGAEFWGVCQVDGYNGLTNYVANWTLIENQIRALHPGSWPWCMFRHKSGVMTNKDAAAMASMQAAQLAWYQTGGKTMYQMPEDMPLNPDGIHPNTAGTLLIAQGWASQLGIYP